MIKRIEKKGICQPCRGTGIYVGMGELNGSGVVCSKCKGTGCFTHVLEWEEFSERKQRREITWVVEVNPGIGIGPSADFGGMSYADWLAGKPFPAGSEMRGFTCPAWYFQALCDRNRPKPDWNECAIGGLFYDCRQFKSKHKCWERWDEEHKKG